jgi:hypothetical protein
VLGSGIEQTFILHRQPAGGAGNLEIDGVIETSLVPRDPAPAAGDALVFVDAAGQPVVRVGRVLVRDAAGRDLLGQLRMQGNRMSIIVDGAWLAAAAYPVEVDPLIGPAFDIGPVAAGIPDVAYSPTSDLYLIVAEQFYAPGDTDIWGYLVNRSGGVVNAGFIIENPGTDQRNPSLGWAAETNKWLVCWEDNRNDPDYDIFCKSIAPVGTSVTQSTIIIANNEPTRKAGRTSPAARTATALSCSRTNIPS